MIKPTFCKSLVLISLLSTLGIASATPVNAQIESFEERTDDWSFVLWEVGTNDLNLVNEIAEAPILIEITPTPVVQVSPSPVENSAEIAPQPTAQSTPAPSEPIAFRNTRGGLSYVGIGGNFGITGDSDLGGRSLAIFSKIGLSNTFSVRPSVLFLSNFATFLIPVTYDLNPFSIGSDFALSPYFGGGIAVKTGSDNTFGPLFTAGVDLPISRSFTLNVAANLSFLRRTDLGLMVGIAYNF